MPYPYLVLGINALAVAALYAFWTKDKKRALNKYYLGIAIYLFVLSVIAIALFN